MNELFPMMAGAVTGAALAFVTSRRRLALGIAAAVVLGAVATIVSGEYKVGWEFLLIDIPLVGFFAVVGFGVTRAVRRATARGRRT